MLRGPWLSLVLLLVAVSTLSVACSEPPPEERLAMTRARYEASLNGFLVEQKPIEVAEPAPAGDEGAEGEETVEPEEEVLDEEPVALRQDVLLDIVIRHESSVKLDGITVDITMADGERELQVWRAWFDTSALEKGPGFQYSHILEDVDYQPGYGFSADIRHPVPPEDRGEYKEFSNLDGG